MIYIHFSTAYIVGAHEARKHRFQICPERDTSGCDAFIYREVFSCWSLWISYTNSRVQVVSKKRIIVQDNIRSSRVADDI